MKFAVGDIVRLNSGGPDMRVLGYEGEDVRVRFESEDTFPEPCVYLVTKGISWAESDVIGQR